MQISPKEFLAMHAISTMPDSHSARKRLLGAVTGALARNNATRLTAQAMLKSIQQQEQLQSELALSFARLNGATHHNGVQ